MLWKQMEQIATARVGVPGYAEMFLLSVPREESGEPSFWLVGRYKDQTKLATDLRASAVLRDELAGLAVRFGLRGSDVPPAGVARQRRYGTTVVGLHGATDFSAHRVTPLARSVRSDQPAPTSRIGDQQANVHSYWMTQTPQSHHVVEFNHLRDIGKSHEGGSGELDHAQLPCVLLAAEFHQRYISSILKATHGLDPGSLRAKLPEVYRSIYLEGSPLFRPLWDAAKLILAAAGIPVA